MPEKVEFSFSETVPGMVWKTLADTEHQRLFVEIRNHETKKVSFSAIDLETRQWLWKEYAFEENWWISLGAVSGSMLLLIVYTDTNNPDKKSVVGFDVMQQKICWWKNDFSLTFISGKFVNGVESKFGQKEINLDIFTGEEVKNEHSVLLASQNFPVIRPFQYPEGHAHFETVRSFLEMKCNISPVFSVEYCEHHSLILISAFSGVEDLANYLIVFNSEGDLVLKETLGEHLKGIATDTFFIFSGYLVFVKNKCELVSYKLV